ncbi:putative molybdenum carrier protein [Maridesulfovibrio sp.]|uniref:putative molybdenum carrier protein n=1 Tax=unclassified Maridesulfovibrio TaxID=2794999 RepID=UPI003B0049D9
MERVAEYGTKKYATCKKCSHTGPLASFGKQAALFPAEIQIICPKCGTISKQNDNSFNKGPDSLPKGLTIISGGQTGVDRGALDAAIERNIPHYGWCPKGRKAEDGTIPSKYNMQETEGWQYWIRTEKNVLDSDGTLIFPGRHKSKGTELTIRLARKHQKPVAVVALDSPDAAETILAWVAANNIRKMNVAGPRESGAPGIGAKTRELLAGL